MQFKVIGKRLILTDSSHEITKGENLYDQVEITLPRYHDGTDNSLLSHRLTVLSENGSRSAAVILSVKDCTDKNITLADRLNENFSAVTGNVTFTLTSIDADGIVGKFSSIPFTIKDDLSVASLPDMNIAEQILNQTHLEAERAVKASQTPAPAQIYPATSTKLGGVKVDGKTITASVDGTISAADSETLIAEIEELKSIIGFTESDIIGLHADFENNVFTRLGAAAGKNAGADFDIFPMYGGRKRCNVIDDGSIAAYYGDDDFAEDGSNGQVMIYQPKFYYKVVPLKLDPQTNGYGYHLRSANYYISDSPKLGFKLHPAFYNEDGEPVDYILLSAYEASIFDASANAYLQNDEQTADFSADKLSSITGVKPCSGKSQNLSRDNIERLAKNRGKGWHGDTVKAESANQMLMAVEFAGFNTQNILGLGAVTISDSPNTENNSIITGGTSANGNLTGSSGGAAGQQAVSYRGMENPWGNIWKLVHGLNEYLDKNGVFHGYMCSDFNFSENKGTDNYQDIGFTFSTKNGYVSAFGYSAEYDWLFIASETQNSSTAQIGDYYWCKAASLNEWRQVLLGGSWFNSTNAGGFCWSLEIISSYRYRYFGSRLIYTPKSKKL